MAETEFHIASFVVHTKPVDSPLVIESLNRMNGIEVHGDNHGKIVVTAEANNTQKLVELADKMQSTSGVIVVASVYHEFLNEEHGAPEIAPTTAGVTKV